MTDRVPNDSRSLGDSFAVAILQWPAVIGAVMLDGPGWELAARIVRDGEFVASAVHDELHYFRKAEPKDKGSNESLSKIVIRIQQFGGERPPYWTLVCHSPGQINSRGYRVHFRDLEWWDLRVPDYWQDNY